MGFLIDTSVWVDVERGTLAPADVAAVTGEEPVFISPITIAELKFGADASRTEALRQKRLASLARLLRKPMLRIDGETGEIFGSLAASLKRSGRGHLFRIQDLWIASQAIQNSVSLLTFNVNDFRDIPGLDLTPMPSGRGRHS